MKELIAILALLALRQLFSAPLESGAGTEPLLLAAGAGPPAQVPAQPIGTQQGNRFDAPGALTDYPRSSGIQTPWDYHVTPGPYGFSWGPPPFSIDLTPKLVL